MINTVFTLPAFPMCFLVRCLILGWRCMDDRLVRDVISEESVVTPAAYLLLYRRKKKDNKQLNGASAATSTLLSYSDPEEID